MSFLGGAKELILVHSTMDEVKTKQKVNVMLTPQFYTLKREEMPFKYAYQAKKIAPSLFDGFIEDEIDTKYMAWKEENEWAFVAYNPEKIATFLEEKGLRRKQIGSVFFADQTVDKFVNPYYLDEESALVKMDNTMVVVPQSALDDGLPRLKFTNRFTPKRGATLSSMDEDTGLFDQKQAIAISAILALFGMEYFIEGKQKTTSLVGNTETLSELYSQYPSLQSSYTRDGITKKLTKIDKEERLKRESLKKIALQIKNGKVLKSLTLTGTNFKAIYE